MTCPSDDDLVAWIEGSGGDAAALEAHVDACETCRAVVAQLASMLGGSRAGRELGRYRLEEPLGAGGMGVVWRAWDPVLERRVAIKLLRPEIHGGRVRLLAEARALARLQHPNVVAVYDVGEADGEIFISTELVDGESFDTWQRDKGASVVAAAYAQAARGLAAAHAAGLVHRDVKPHNLLMGRDGRVRVGDFGLARSTDSPVSIVRSKVDTDARTESGPSPIGGLTVDGHVVGTPAYMAPEQRTGAGADARADQFSLCVALVEALVGRRPTSNVTAERLERDGLAGPLAAVLAVGLAFLPEERHASIAAIADALDEMPVPAKIATRGSSAFLARVARPNPSSTGDVTDASDAGATIRDERRASLPVPPFVLAGILILIGGAIAIVLIVTRDRGPARAATPATPPPAPTSTITVTPIEPPPTPTSPNVGVVTAPSPAPPASKQPTKPKQPSKSPPTETAFTTTTTTTTPPRAASSPIGRQPDRNHEAEKYQIRRDGKTCLAVLDEPNGLPPGSEATRATCEMLAGKCAAGIERYKRWQESTGRGDDRYAQLIGDIYCRPTDGTLRDRVRRMWRQIEHNQHRGSSTGCDDYTGYMVDLLGEKLEVPSTLKDGVVALIECQAKKPDCGRAHDLVAAAAKAGIKDVTTSCTP